MPLILRLPLLAVPLLVISACGDKDEDTGPEYCAPTSDAGPDQSIAYGDAVNLDGSASGYGEGCEQDHELNYSWSVESVPVESAIDEGSLTDNNTTTASTSSFVPDTTGTYVLSLAVCDEQECSDPSLVIIEVAATDPAPIADAGEDVQGEVGVRVELDGSGSYDPDGSELEYSWSLSSVPNCSALTSGDLFNATSVDPSILTDCEGVFVAALVVSDGLNWSSPDYVSIRATSGNQPPVSDPGDFEVLPPCLEEYIELNGFGSYDPEGEPLMFQWSLVSVPADSTATDANFSDPTLPDPLFYWDVVGDYTFQLEVFDGVLWSAPDIAILTVQDITQNQSPVSNAGEDESQDASTSCTRSSYVWTCDDCEPQDFDLTAGLSMDPDGDELSYTWSDATNQTTIESPYSANTVVWSPPVSTPRPTDITSYSWDIALEVADCSLGDTDAVTITVNCIGQE